jgi:Lon protease-like protein
MRRMIDPTTDTDWSAVPLFPLPNVVLFPRAILPLHIFEQRYRAMTADALCGKRQIAMALLQPGWEKESRERPALEPVLCVGTILTHQRLPDGRYNLLLQGISRCTIVREHKHAPYRVAELRPLEEARVFEIDLDDERRRIEGVFDNPCFRDADVARQFRDLLASPMPTADLADLITFHFLEDVQLRQSILADADVRRRVHRVASAFEQQHSSLSAACAEDFLSSPNIN